MVRCEAPGWVVERLEVFIKLSEAIQVACDLKIPKGTGPLSFEVLCREVAGWSRFNNDPEQVQALR